MVRLSALYLSSGNIGSKGNRKLADCLQLQKVCMYSWAA